MSKYSLTEKMQLAAWYVADKIKRNLSLSNPKSWNSALWNLYGVGQTESGVRVDEYTAMNLAAVYAAINIISGDIATLPLGLFKTVSNKRKRITDHKSLQVLTYRANPLMPAINVRRTMTAHMLSWGNMYGEIVRDQMNNVIALWPLTPDRVTPRMDRGDLVYYVKVDKEDVPVSRENILHISGLGYDGIMGYSVISKAAESIGLSMASEKFGARYFGANTNMGGAIKYPRALGEEAKNNLRKSLSGYTGSDNSHRWMILEQGMEIEKLGFSPDDSQFLQTRQFQVPEIARWFNMPPHKLKDLTRSTFSNIEEQETEYVVSCLVPWLTIIEQNYNIQLLTEKEHRLGYYFKHNVKGLLRGSSAARADYYTKRFYLGTITPNEIRAFEDEDPLETEYADKTYIQQNLMPLEDVDKEPEPIIQPALEGQPGEQPPDAEEPEPEVKIWASKHIQLRAQKSVKKRDRITKRYYPLIEEAAARIVYRESGLVVKHFKSAIGEIERAYDGFQAYIVAKIGPVFKAFSEDIYNQATLEVGKEIEETPEDVLIEINSYTSAYARRHVGSSVGQLTKIIRDNNEDINDLVVERLDEWKEKRSTKIASNESVRLASFMAQTAFFSYGFKSYWRIRGVDTCPYCMELNGQAIKQGQNFFNGGEEIQPKGAERPMLIGGIVTHPPLHQGCDCYISA
ncbi:MAG: phage portal protein [Nitrospinales bacterium]